MLRSFHDKVGLTNANRVYQHEWLSWSMAASFDWTHEIELDRHLRQVTKPNTK
jgi:hypothetical protein